MLWRKILTLKEFKLAKKIISLAEGRVGKDYTPVNNKQDVQDSGYACFVISFFKGDELQDVLGKTIAKFLNPNIYKKYEHLEKDQTKKIKEMLVEGYVNLIKEKLGKNYGDISESIEENILLPFSDALETTTHLLKLPHDPFLDPAQLSEQLGSTFSLVLAKISLDESLNHNKKSPSKINKDL